MIKKNNLFFKAHKMLHGLYSYSDRETNDISVLVAF